MTQWSSWPWLCYDIFRHSKIYASWTEENARREIWKEEMEMVDKHNKEAEVPMIVMIMIVMVMVIMEMVTKMEMVMVIKIMVIIMVLTI